MVTSRLAFAWLLVLVVLMLNGCRPSWHDRVMNDGVAARAVVTSLDQTGASLTTNPSATWPSGSSPRTASRSLQPCAPTSY